MTAPRPPARADDQAPVDLSVDVDPEVVKVARSAAETEAARGDSVGEHLGAFGEDDVAVTVIFAVTDPGYHGWTWCVTVARVGGAAPTISEVVMLPGHDALLAPAWLPWDERIRPGDLGVGDLLPVDSSDIRVVPAYLESDDPAVEDVAHELGIGRVRVLSREGRVDAAERWHDGPYGPEAGMAVAAPAHCATCAFYLPIAGSLGQLFGACGNEFAPADGRVVDAGYGCGAHSEAIVVLPSRIATPDSVIDELQMELHERPAITEPEPAGEPAPDRTELVGAADVVEILAIAGIVENAVAAGDPTEDDPANEVPDLPDEPIEPAEPADAGQD